MAIIYIAFDFVVRYRIENRIYFTFKKSGPDPTSNLSLQKKTVFPLIFCFLFFRGSPLNPPRHWVGPGLLVWWARRERREYVPPSSWIQRDINSFSWISPNPQTGDYWGRREYVPPSSWILRDISSFSWISPNPQTGDYWGRRENVPP